MFMQCAEKKSFHVYYGTSLLSLAICSRAPLIGMRVAREGDNFLCGMWHVCDVYDMVHS